MQMFNPMMMMGAPYMPAFFP